MNKVILVGRLTADPVVKKVNKKSCCNFTVAINCGKDEANFINCTAWGVTADFLKQYFEKGNRIVIEGHLVTNTYTDSEHKDVTHYSTFVSVYKVEFAD